MSHSWLKIRTAVGSDDQVRKHLQGLAQDLLVLAAVLVRTVVPVDASDKIA